MHSVLETSKIDSSDPQNIDLRKHNLGPNDQNVVGRERFELSTFRLSAERSSQAELPAHIRAIYYELLIVFKGFRNTFNRILTILKWARSPVWIKASAFGAEERGFKSLRVRSFLGAKPYVKRRSAR